MVLLMALKVDSNYSELLYKTPFFNVFHLLHFRNSSNMRTHKIDIPEFWKFWWHSPIKIFI